MLCGLMFVEGTEGTRAINWSLSSYRSDASLMFMDPRDGTMKVRACVNLEVWTLMVVSGEYALGLQDPFRSVLSVNH